VWIGAPSTEWECMSNGGSNSKASRRTLVIKQVGIQSVLS